MPPVFPAVGDGLGRFAGDVDLELVAQVLADSGQVVDDVDADGLELVGRTDAGKEQQPRGVDGARTDDDLGIGVGGMAGAFSRVLQPRGSTVID